MSALSIVNGVPDKPTSLRLTGTGETDVFTNSNPSTSTPKFQAILAIVVANETGSAATINLERYDGATDFLFFRRSVPANDTVDVPGPFPIYLKPGDKIKATAGTGNALTVNIASVQLGD